MEISAKESELYSAGILLCSDTARVYPGDGPVLTVQCSVVVVPMKSHIFRLPMREL